MSKKINLAENYQPTVKDDSDFLKSLFLSFSKNGPLDDEIDKKLKKLTDDMDKEIGSSMSPGDIRLAAGNFYMGYMLGKSNG